MSSYTDYWMLRKRFTAQYATATLMAYIFSVGHRMPHKIMISRSTGNVWMTELLPGKPFSIFDLLFLANANYFLLF